MAYMLASSGREQGDVPCGFWCGLGDLALGRINAPVFRLPVALDNLTNALQFFAGCPNRYMAHPQPLGDGPVADLGAVLEFGLNQAAPLLLVQVAAGHVEFYECSP